MKRHRVAKTLARLSLRLAIFASLAGVFSAFDRAEAADPADLLADHLVTTTADDGAGSLRQAMRDANASAGPDRILFDILGCGRACVIRPSSPLPDLTDDGISIHGLSQPGARPPVADREAIIFIELDGSAVENDDGINILSADNVVEGLSIHGFGGHGIAIRGPEATGNTIRMNHIGLTSEGTGSERRRPNGRDGVFIGLGARGNVIGGDLLTERNVVSGNTRSGVGVHGSETRSNIISGNFIGLNAHGDAQIGNGLDGVHVHGGATGTIIGVASEAEKRNVISGNLRDGIRVAGGETVDTAIDGNRIGTDQIGNVAIGNEGVGIHMMEGANDVRLGAGDAPSIGLVSGNDGDGIRIENASDVLVRLHVIGVNAGGTQALPNSDGIRITDSSAIRIGDEEVGNLVSGNTGAGIRLSGAGTVDFRLLRNRVGLTEAGTAVIANEGTGILVEDGVSNGQIGQAGIGNVVSGNEGHGIHIQGPGTSNVAVQANLIGLTTDGEISVGNGQSGVVVDSEARDTTIGGDVPADGNHICANQVGMLLNNARSTAVRLNWIGEHPDAVLFGCGNAIAGIRMDGGTRDSRIDDNVIAHNGEDGVIAVGQSTVGNRLSRNRIFGNGREGIRLAGGAHGALPPPVITGYDPDRRIVRGEMCDTCEVALFSDAEDEGREPLPLAGLPITRSSLTARRPVEPTLLSRMRGARRAQDDARPAAVQFVVRLESRPSYANFTAIQTHPEFGSSEFSMPRQVPGPTPIASRVPSSSVPEWKIWLPALRNAAVP